VTFSSGLFLSYAFQFSALIFTTFLRSHSPGRKLGNRRWKVLDYKSTFHRLCTFVRYTY